MLALEAIPALAGWIAKRALPAQIVAPAQLVAEETRIQALRLREATDVDANSIFTASSLGVLVAANVFNPLLSRRRWGAI